MEKKLYFVGLRPPDDLSEVITAIKEDLAARYGCRHALNVPPHVTLVPPFRAAATDDLREALAGYAARVAPVALHLEGFGYFAHPRDRVIYIAVRATKALEDLSGELRSLTRTILALSAADATREFRPHITLAHRDLTAAAFHLAWPAYRDRVFEASCLGNALTLFAHDGKCWLPDARYPLAGEI